MKWTSVIKFCSLIPLRTFLRINNNYHGTLQFVIPRINDCFSPLNFIPSCQLTLNWKGLSATYVQSAPLYRNKRMTFKRRTFKIPWTTVKKSFLRIFHWKVFHCVFFKSSLVPECTLLYLSSISIRNVLSTKTAKTIEAEYYLCLSPLKWVTTFKWAFIRNQAESSVHTRKRHAWKH